MLNCLELDQQTADWGKKVGFFKGQRELMDLSTFFFSNVKAFGVLPSGGRFQCGQLTG